MNTTAIYRVAAFSAPLVCIGIAVALATVETVRLHSFAADTLATNTKITAARTLIADIEKRGSAGFITLEPDSRQEQVTFVNSLRTVADQCHVRLTQWASGTAAPISVPDSSDKTLKDLIACVSPVTNQVGVGGAYADIRSFLRTLLQQDRFVTISGIKWIRAAKPPDTFISFQITRFVDVGAPPVK